MQCGARVCRCVQSGFTAAVISQFESVEGMKYYDDECKAHAALKKVAKSVHHGAMMLYFDNGLI